MNTIASTQIDYGASRTKLEIFDLRDRANPKKVREIFLSGALIAARRIGTTTHTVVADNLQLFPELTYYPSEFSRVRLQLQYDDVLGLSEEAPGNRDGNFSVWLGFDLSLGKHGAHKF